MEPHRSIFDARLRPYGHIEHYYGDATRELFVAAAVILCAAIPVWGNLLPFGTLIEIVGALVLVLLAGLTNPDGKTVHLYNAIVSGLGVLFLEYTAVALHHIQSTELFFAREAAAILLLFAFYFSIKTARAVMQGKVRSAPEQKEPEVHDIEESEVR